MNYQLPLLVIFLSFLPSGVASLYIINKNKSLNKALFIKLLLWGALSVLPGIIIVSLLSSYKGNGLVSTYLYGPFITVALVEELIKLTILILILYRNDNLKSISDGIQYSIAITIGFAFAENIVYLTGATDQLSLVISRSLTALPLHAVCGAIMGYFAGLGKTTETRYKGKALIWTTAIHGLYNIFITLNFPYYLLSIILIIFSLIILKQQYRKNSP